MGRGEKRRGEERRKEKRRQIEEDWFCADCYLSVISAFLSVMTAEMSKRDGGRAKRQNEGRDEEDVWTAIKCFTNRKCSLRMPQLLCLASLPLLLNQSSMTRSYNNFQV